MNKKAMIVSGGSIDEEFALQIFGEVQPKYVIGVDGGLAFLYKSHIVPTHILGDFDSVPTNVIEFYRTKTEILIRQFRPEKDATDTELAVRFSIDLGVEELWILGATGTRLDHVLANIQVLKIAHNHGVKAYILDPCNRISVAEKEVRLEKGTHFGTYFSLFAFGSVVENLCIEGAKYPLEHYRLCPDDSRCVSNEIEAEKVKITFSEGMIILMETRDQ